MLSSAAQIRARCGDYRGGGGGVRARVYGRSNAATCVRVVGVGSKRGISQYSPTREKRPGRQAGSFVRQSGDRKNAPEGGVLARVPPHPPPDSNGAASAAAGKVDDGGPNTNGAVATAGAAAAAGAANVDGAVPKENAGMVVAAEALLACCENPPNAVAAAGPPNGAVLLPSITAALCAPNKPYGPARSDRDTADPAARHDHAFTQAHACSLRGRERGATSGGEWERRAEGRGRVEVRGTGTEGKRRDRRVRSRFAHHTNTMVVVDCVCTGAATPPCLRVGSKRELGQYWRTSAKRAGGRAGGRPRATQWGWKDAPEGGVLAGVPPNMSSAAAGVAVLPVDGGGRKMNGAAAYVYRYTYIAGNIDVYTSVYSYIYMNGQLPAQPPLRL